MNFVKGCAIGLAFVLAAAALSFGLHWLKASFGPIAPLAALTAALMLFFGFLYARYPQ